MSTHCCLVCPHQPTCADLIDATFARPGEIVPTATKETP